MRQSNKSCPNCRGRRLRFDRSWPTCHKCAIRGQKDLGFGKMFDWKQGIDEYGNLKSLSKSRRTLSVLASNSPSTFMTQTSAVSDFPASATMSSSGGQASQSIAAPSHHHHHHSQFDQFPAPRRISQSLSTPDKPGAVHDKPSSSGLFVGKLTEPLFQDLDRKSRYYLAYFADRVCQDFGVRDHPSRPGKHPFQQLFPLTHKHPLLLQILIATSAIYWCNVSCHIKDIPTGLTDPGDYLAHRRSKDLVSRQALLDALIAKEKAMGHLMEVLRTLDPARGEVALAAICFFIKFDLIDLHDCQEFGWKAHLEGAAYILASLPPETMTSTLPSLLRDTVITELVTYCILGSTLSSSGLAANIARYFFKFLPVMKRAGIYSHLSCPPEILRIILEASQLSYESASVTDLLPTLPEEATFLFNQALAFDIAAWAAEIQAQSHVSDMESRVHVASAHRSAACLYILQALPVTSGVQPVDVGFLVDDVLSHLTAVGEEDPYFKATGWPSFIAGAEVRNIEKRTYLTKRMLSIWGRFRWGYIFRAIEMLKATWKLRDEAVDNGHGLNWLGGLKGLDFDCLIV